MREVIISIIQVLIKCLWIFPIKKKRIIFTSFGGQFSDSPKYIYEYMVKEKKYDYIWVSDSDINENNIKTIPSHGFLFFYYCSTAKVIVTNDFLNTYYPRRPGQIIINTWHGGSPLKTVGMVGKKADDKEIKFFKHHDKIYTHFLSSSRFVTEEVFRKSFGYTGKIIESGMPRNAVLLRTHNSQRKKVYDFYGLSNDIDLVLYAPTFRGDANHGGFINEDEQFDISKVLSVLEKKYNKKFVFLFRAHHSFKYKLKDNKVIDASNYPDIQELLCAITVLITDYSSCMGDAALIKIPTFLYCPDLDDYRSERGFYWDIYYLPFPVSLTEKDLYKTILTFDQEQYNNAVDLYLNRLGSFENSHSDVDVGQKIIEYMEGNQE